MRTRCLAVLACLPLVLLAAPAPATTHRDGSSGRIVWTQVLDKKFSQARLVSSRPDGSDRRALTDPGGKRFDLNGVVSPDGDRVVFERDRPDGSARLFLAGTDHTAVRPLPVRCAGRCNGLQEPTWAPGGKRVVYTAVVGPFDQVNDSARSAVLHTARLDGSGVRRLSQRGIDGAFEDYHATYTPSGGHIVFTRVRNRDIKAAVFRMRRDGTHVRRLTPWRLGADLAAVSPATSGSTEGLVVFETFGTGAPEGRSQDIATVPVDCAPAECRDQIRLLTHHGAGPGASYNPNWSPDGRRIVFTEASGTHADIWTMGARGHHRERVSHSPRFEFRPDWG